jgi:hypothetical protein
MKCDFCLTDAARLNRNLPCCQLRQLANAPPHIVRAAEAEPAKRGIDALRQFQAQLDAERKRLAELRQRRVNHIASLSMNHIAQVLNSGEP